jgi:hypothetical protein
MQSRIRTRNRVAEDLLPLHQLQFGRVEYFDPLLFDTYMAKEDPPLDKPTEQWAQREIEVPPWPVFSKPTRASARRRARTELKVLPDGITLM